MSDYYISDEFKAGLSSMINGIAQRQNHIENLRRSIEGHKSTSKWVDERLAKLAGERRLYTKHKEELKHQKRHAEIQLAFELHEWSLIPDSLLSFYGHPRKL